MRLVRSIGDTYAVTGEAHALPPGGPPPAQPGTEARVQKELSFAVASFMNRASTLAQKGVTGPRSPLLDTPIAGDARERAYGGPPGGLDRAAYEREGGGGLTAATGTAIAVGVGLVALLGYVLLKPKRRR